jgi:hypothetical protein
MRLDRFFLRVEEKPCLSMAGVAGVRQLGSCTRVWLPPLGRQRTGLFHGAPRKMHGGDTLGRLLFVTAEPHSLGGGGGQHRGRRMGMWLRSLLLAEPPVESWAIHAMETRLRWRSGRRKLEKRIEGGRQGRAFIKKVRMRK